MNVIDLDEKLGLFSDHWSPRIIAATNGQEVKIAKFRGAFNGIRIPMPTKCSWYFMARSPWNSGITPWKSTKVK